MSNSLFDIVESELDFLGDILSAGIIKKGLMKVGSSPDDASINDFYQALDQHIEVALQSFVGKAEAHKKVLVIKKRLEEHGRAA